MPLTIAAILDSDVSSVITLWQRTGLTRPWNEPAKDIEFAQRSTQTEILIGKEKSKIIASVMVGHDGHRGVVYYLAVDPEHQTRGLGREMMAAAESWLIDKGVWKLNLMIRAENHQVRSFYETLGYEEEKRIVMARHLGNAGSTSE